MAIQEKINANPTVYAVNTSASKKYDVFDDNTDEESVDPFEADEVFGSFASFLVGSMDDDTGADRLCMYSLRTEVLRHINDPEHPLTLEQLKVMSLENIHVDDKKSLVKVFFTPTIPHCRYDKRTAREGCALSWLLFRIALADSRVCVSAVWRRLSVSASV